jgi:U4/U6.U5 tri-snRNP-associated protein 1
LTGSTLGDVGEGDDDTISWVKKNKKLAREMAKRKQKEMEEMDSQFQQTYDESTCCKMLLP